MFAFGRAPSAARSQQRPTSREDDVRRAGIDCWVFIRKKDTRILTFLLRLNELQSGSLDGLTYADVESHHPEEWEARETDKLRYRYPKGETVVVHDSNYISRDIERYFCGITRFLCCKTWHGKLIIVSRGIHHGFLSLPQVNPTLTAALASPPSCLRWRTTTTWWSWPTRPSWGACSDTCSIDRRRRYLTSRYRSTQSCR